LAGDPYFVGSGGAGIVDREPKVLSRATIPNKTKWPCLHETREP